MEENNEGMTETTKPQIGNHIPDEISEEILILLPVKPLLRFRSVCKAWKTLIDSDSFKMKHLQHATTTSVSAISVCDITYKPSLYFQSPNLHEWVPSPHTLDCFGDCISINMKFFGFVNGLALVCWNDVGLIWNPLTNEVRKITPFARQEKMCCYDSVVGLGFDPNTKDYKVLFANFSNVYKSKELCEVDFRLYSLSSDSWKTWSCVCPRVSSVSVSSDGFLDGKLYWNAQECVKEDGSSSTPGVIVFDFCDESFEIMPFTGELSAAQHFVAVTTRGCLEIVGIFGEYDEERYGEIWGMEEDGSWTRKVRVVLSSRVGYPLA